MRGTDASAEEETRMATAAADAAADREGEEAPLFHSRSRIEGSGKKEIVLSRVKNLGYKICSIM